MRDHEFAVSNARIWGGIHYRSAVEAGVEIGKQMAEHVARSRLRRVTRRLRDEHQR
jgi:hypothetical protein